MALRNQPYIPLYIKDFLTDEKLMECSANATGVYIKIMCFMHKSDCYGKILLKQKDKQSEDQIKNFATKFVRFLSFSYDEIHAGLCELIEHGVLNIEENTLFQKRMVKDGQTSLSRSITGKLGGEVTAEKIAKAKNKAKPKAKKDQNTVNVNVNVNEYKIIKGVDPANYPWQTEQFAQWWQKWLTYKQKEHKFVYKHTESELVALGLLKEKANANESLAIAIIRNAIDRRWKGLFLTEELKNGNTKKIGRTDADSLAKFVTDTD